MPSNHLFLCRPLLLPPSIFHSMRVFSNESVLHIRWPKYWSFSCSISPSNEYSGLISFGLTGWISLQSKGLSRVSSNTTVQKHHLFGAQPSLWPNSHLYMTTGKTIALTKIHTNTHIHKTQTYTQPTPHPRIRNEFNMENSYFLYVELRLPVDNLCLNRDLLIEEKIS